MSIAVRAFVRLKSGLGNLRQIYYENLPNNKFL